MAVNLVFETHAMTEDNETGRATERVPLEDLLDAEFAWRPGWDYRLDT